MTDGVAVVTPQTRDDFRAGPTILVLVGCCKHSVLLCFYCVSKDSFLDFAGMVEICKKNKLDSFETPEKLFGHAFFVQQHLVVSGFQIYVVSNHVGLLLYQFS